MVEAAYDFERSPSEWLQQLLASGGEALDRGLGCAAAVGAGLSDEGTPLVARMQLRAGPADFAGRLVEAVQGAGPDLAWAAKPASRQGVRVLSEATEARERVRRCIQQTVGCEDVLGLWALDADLRGVVIHVPSPERIELSRQARQRWEMLAAHIAAAHHLRRAVGLVDPRPGRPLDELILNRVSLEALLSESSAPRDDGAELASIRIAAMRADREEHSGGRGDDPDEAREIWRALVRGRWSMVDWFDREGRRFVLARSNEPSAGDPRALTERELQVIDCAARGESGKVTGYTLGISQTRVSCLLRSAMRKLGVRTHAELVMRLSCLPVATNAAEGSNEHDLKIGKERH